MPDSKKIPLEEEKERYKEFLKDLHAIKKEYDAKNETKLRTLKDTLARFLGRFVSEADKKEFLRKTRSFFIISSAETQSQQYERQANDFHQLYSDMENYLNSSIKTLDYALNTDYLREESDAIRRGIVLSRKSKGGQIEIIDQLREENKRLKKDLKEAISKIKK